MTGKNGDWKIYEKMGKFREHNGKITQKKIGKISTRLLVGGKSDESFGAIFQDLLTSVATFRRNVSTQLARQIRKKITT